MPPERRCFSVLIISGKKQSSSLLSAMLDSSVYRPVDTALSAGEARRKMLNVSYDILIIDPPLPDESGSEFAIDASANTHAGILLTVRNDLFDMTCSKVGKYGVLTLPKPVSQRDFYLAVRLITATSARLLNEEKKLVSRAKFILMEKMKITEPEAHRFIEKEAMDSRRTKKEIATDIINNN